MTFLTLLAHLVLSVPSEPSSNWPSFRGPRGDGHSEAKGLPVRWSESQNIRWKTAIHDRGWSSPVVWDGQIWLTTATESGHDMFVLCLDRETGKVLRDIKFLHIETPEPLGTDVNSYASPTPAIEAGSVYVHFGSYGTACLDSASGETRWLRRDLPCRHFRGPGSSPILFKELLILTMDGFDVEYVCALDKHTGKTVWKTDRSYPWGDLDGDIRKSYTTPIVVDGPGGLQLLSGGAKAAYSYDPVTGKEIWKINYDGFSNASMAVAGHGLAFINTGFGKADLWAIRLSSKGEIPGSEIVWKCTQGVPLKPSPLLGGDWIFMTSDTGVATMIESKTGKQLWQKRVGGKFSASPILAEGRIYAFGEDGKAFVVKPGAAYEEIAVNELDSGLMASPAVAGKALFIRTKTHLYRIEE